MGKGEASQTMFKKLKKSIFEHYKEYCIQTQEDRTMSLPPVKALLWVTTVYLIFISYLQLDDGVYTLQHFSSFWDGMKYQSPQMKGLTPDLLIWLFGFAALTGKEEMVGGEVCKYVSVQQV